MRISCTLGPVARLRQSACRGPLEAARPCQRHRVVVRSVPPCPRGVRAGNRSGGLSGLGTPDRMARRFGEGFRARDDPPSGFPAWMLLEEPGLAAALAPRRTDDDPSRAFDATMWLLAHPSLDGHGIELRRSLQAIHPGLLERFLAKRAPATAPVPLLGKKTGTPDSHRRRCDQLRRNAIDRARLCSPTPGFPPRLRYSSPRFDAWRMRFDDGLEGNPATAAHFFRSSSDPKLEA